MRQRRVMLAGLLVLGFGGATAAQAQQAYYYGPQGYGPQDYGPHYYEPTLPPYEIMRIVRTTGLAPLSRPIRRGATYVVVAANRSGGQMRVVIDAMTGDIMTVNPMVVARPYGAPPQYSPEQAAQGQYDGDPALYGPGPRYDGGLAPVPPREVPGRMATAPMHPPGPGGATPPRDVPNARATAPAPRVANAQPATPPAAATHTPLPRPRPRPKLAASAEPPRAPVPPPVAAKPPVIAVAPASAPTPAPATVPSATAPAIINPGAPQSADGPQLVPVAPLE